MKQNPHIASFWRGSGGKILAVHSHWGECWWILFSPLEIDGAAALENFVLPWLMGMHSVLVCWIASLDLDLVYTYSRKVIERPGALQVCKNGTQYLKFRYAIPANRKSAKQFSVHPNQFSFKCGTSKTTMPHCCLMYTGPPLHLSTPPTPFPPHFSRRCTPGCTLYVAK